LSSVIETPRLTLGRLEPADLPAFLAYRNDPEVARYQSWETISEADGAALIAEQATFAPGTPGRWAQLAVRLRDGGALVGDLALHVEAADPRLGEIGFTFDRRFQGRGLAQEAVRALLDLAFGTLGLHRVRAIVDCRNAAAVRLLERLGMRREGHFVQHAWFKGAWCDESLYAMLRDEWQVAPHRHDAPDPVSPAPAARPSRGR
jgi:RimJ/RimL family protein N-acetyltransferase